MTSATEQASRRGRRQRRCYDFAVRIPFHVPDAGSRPFDVAGLGVNSVDLIAVVAEYPPSNSKQRLQRFARLAGGEIATALTVCARLGWMATYVGSFGNDDLGRLSRDSLSAEGIDLSGSRTVAGTNQFAIILVDARSGERTVLWDRHPALSLDATAVRADAVTAGRFLLLDCYDTAAATQAARYARAARIPTVLDVDKVRPGLNELLPHIDAIIASEGLPAELTGYDEPGRALEAIAREFQAPLVCTTLGDQGSLARCGGREYRTAPFSVDCVDSTGAGDAFRGGFTAACLRAPDGDIADVLTYANAVAALNCRALGASGGAPSAAEVEQLLMVRPQV